MASSVLIYTQGEEWRSETSPLKQCLKKHFLDLDHHRQTVAYLWPQHAHWGGLTLVGLNWIRLDWEQQTQCHTMQHQQILIICFSAFNLLA